MYDAQEVTTSNKFGLRNWKMLIPGTCVTAYLGVRATEPYVWQYSLWSNDDDDTRVSLVSCGALDMSDVGPDNSPVNITPEQAARIAFLLEVEYAS